MANLVEANIAVFADQIISIVNAVITGTNFNVNAPIVIAPANFGWANMQSAWGLLKKSSTKNAILDGEYLAQIINVPTQFQKSGVEAGKAWGGFGWDNVALNTNWTGADANVRGLICGPTAIGLLSGMPLTPPSHPGNTLQTDTVTVPGPDLSIQMNRWFDLGARTLWYSYDVMFGASLLDATAGIIIRSA
jgi:hypothetical protein